jgi:hypothetical protein
MLEKFFSRAARIRLDSGLLLVTIIAWPIANDAAAEGGLLHLRCTNPVGGANWSVAVDLDRGLVDSRPATISGSWIKWTDGKGGTYELERATGKLQLRAASTTGGYFLHYTCQSE